MRSIDEKSWQSYVVETAQLFGWIVYHTYDSRRSAAGFPDLVLVRTHGRAGPQLIFAELKTDRGKLSTAQRAWMHALTIVAGLSSERVRAVVWRPRDRGQVEHALRVGIFT